MIQIGLTGWSDHDVIPSNAKSKLRDYAAHFPIVELDTSFYAIPSEQNILNWMDQTPDNFQFIAKAYGPLTQHARRPEETKSIEELFIIFQNRFQPMMNSGKLKTFLFQFPPYFSCVKENVQYLREVRYLMDDLPIAVEFRHPSWFSEDYQNETLNLLKRLSFTHVVVDQPQTPNNSVPFVPIATQPGLAFIRLHGRNYQGWLGADDTQDWRTIRTLYDYSEVELEEIKQATLDLAQQAKDVVVIFNNNSGGHAAPNAKKFQQLLGIDYEGLAPRQLGLF